jgi:hypothetical protein
MVLQQCTGEAKQEEIYCKNKSVIFILLSCEVWRSLRYHPDSLSHFLQVPWIDTDISKSNWVGTALHK